MAASGQRDPEGLQDPEDVPSSQVSLPFSSSMTNRSPVPEVKARAFCVTPRRLRVSRITLPICWVCISSPSPKCYRTGSIWADLRQISNKYSRTGTSSSKPIKFLNHSRTGTLFELGNKAKEFIEECASKSWSLPQGDFLSLAILRYVGRCFVSGKN
jgi:hypothetical protein